MGKHLVESGSSFNVTNTMNVVSGEFFIPVRSSVHDVSNPVSGQVYLVPGSSVLAIYSGDSWDTFAVSGNPGSSIDTLLLGIGNVTEDSMEYHSRLQADGAKLQIKYSTNDDLSSPITSNGTSVSSDDNNTGSEVVTGLNANTVYFYDILIDGTPMFGQSPYPQFTTAPSGGQDAEFSFIWASCQSGSMSDIFNSISGESPAFMAHLGDFRYIDSTDIDDLRNGYEALYDGNSQYVSGVVRKMMVAHTWDDHDYAGNNTAKDASGKENSLQVFDEYRPHYDFVNQNSSGIFYKFTWGNAEIFMLDTRYLKHPNDDTLRFPGSSTNTAHDSTSGTLTIKAEDSPSGVDDIYAGWYINISGNVRLIVDYDSGTSGLTFDRPIEGVSGPADYYLSGKSILNGCHEPSGGQVEWLVSGINDSTKRWKFIMSSIPFASGFDTGASDHWGGYDSPDFVERDYLNQAISGNNVIFLCGDKHFAGLDNGDNYGKFPICMAGSLVQTTPSAFGTWSNGTYTGNNYGKVKIETSPDHKLEISIHNDAGNREAIMNIFDANNENNPLNVSGIRIWLTSDQDTLFTDSAKETGVASGDSIHVWENQASGTDAIEATASQQPTFHTNYFNGHDAIVFDGTELITIDDLAGKIFGGQDGPFSVFFVMKQNSLGNQNVIGVGNSSITTQAISIGTRDDGGGGSDDVYRIRKSDDFGSVVTPEGGTPDTSGMYLINFKTSPDGQEISIFQNGSGLNLNAGFDVSTSSFDRLTIGGMRRTTESPTYDGALFEVIMYSDADFATEERERVQNYISNKYGIVMSGGA